MKYKVQYNNRRSGTGRDGTGPTRGTGQGGRRIEGGGGRRTAEEWSEGERGTETGMEGGAERGT